MADSKHNDAAARARAARVEAEQVIDAIVASTAHLAQGRDA